VSIPDLGRKLARERSAFFRALALGSLLLTSCSSEPASPQASSDGGLHAYDAGGVACLDYSDAGYRTFPEEPAPSSSDLPLCPPSCHPRTATAGAGTAPLDQDLPSGPCSDEGAACRSGLTAGWCGPCLDTGGPGNEYFCSCQGGAWRCALTSRGLNMCDAPSCIDFGGDADGGVCRDLSLTATQVCACGNCLPRCETNADCDGGTCRVNSLCFAAASCPGPDECPATCTGVCDG
jgi:hypothetical protein